ncbi:MAG: hypothetical protein L3K02_08885 [Thermoplasmata archaeon]|nr:hypothetical protein [Thermoplasmata archaeon]
MIEGTVNDSIGNQANATLNLTVTNGFGPPPTILSYAAWPAVGAVGKITYFSVTAKSNNGDPTLFLTYSFLGLPPGCDTFNQTNLTCIPLEPGQYQVWVRVIDSYAGFTQKYMFYNVTGNATSTNSGGSHISTTEVEYIIGGVVAVGLVLGVVTYFRHVRKPPAKSPSPPSEAVPKDGDFHPFKLE